MSMVRAVYKRIISARVFTTRKSEYGEALILTNKIGTLMGIAAATPLCSSIPMGTFMVFGTQQVS
jgi:hypothetical protein